MATSIADKKRSRGANFSPSECELLIKLVKKHKNIIENKISDAATWKDKEKTWMELEQDFNSASGGIYRTVAALKAKYDSLKRETRKAWSKLRSDKYKTGGGTVTAPPLTLLQEDIHQLIALSVEGMESHFDTDALEVEDHNIISINEIASEDTAEPQGKAEPQSSCSIDPWEKFDKLVQPSSPTPLPSSATNEANIIEKWNKWNPKTLRSKKHPVLAKAPKKRPYEVLAEKKMELIEKQRSMLDEQEANTATQNVNAEKNQAYKLREHELRVESLLQDIRHKETMFNLKIKMMEEEHNLKIKMLSQNKE